MNSNEEQQRLSDALRAVGELSRYAFDQGVFAATCGSDDSRTVEARDKREAAEETIRAVLFRLMMDGDR